MISLLKEFLVGIPANLTSEYFVLAGAQLVVIGTVWLFLRRRVRISARTACDALVLALIFAPSVFGMDMGATTLPATLVIAIAMIGAASTAAFVCAFIFIGVLWLFIFLVFKIVLHYRRGSKAVTK
jgi:hypothetical protein